MIATIIAAPPEPGRGAIPWARYGCPPVDRFSGNWKWRRCEIDHGAGRSRADAALDLAILASCSVPDDLERLHSAAPDGGLARHDRERPVGWWDLPATPGLRVPFGYHGHHENDRVPCEPSSTGFRPSQPAAGSST
jgi:hypothetical protein